MITLTSQSVPRTIVRLALPMLAGTFAINIYNLTDTWFVSRLGTNPLAAISFAMPVTMMLSFVMMALGSGTMTVVAHALGGGKHSKAARITSHSILLMALFSLVLAACGLSSMNWLFGRLGAAGESLELTRQFMTIWYIGMPVMALQSMLASVLISTGNTKASSALMVAGNLINLALAPVMIFGLVGFPRLGIRGAALATLLSQACILGLTLRVLHRRHRLLSAAVRSYRRIAVSWRRVLNMGVPAIYSSILTPLSAAIITRIVAGYGEPAVAALGVAGRIEMFSFMVPMSVGMSLTPFVAQNFGAGRLDRIHEARRLTTVFALGYGLLMTACFFLAAEPLSGLFSNDPALRSVLVKYIHITCFGYGFMEVHRYSTCFMNGIQKPLNSAALNTLRIVALLIPLAIVGSRLYGLNGLFAGRLIADIVSAVAGLYFVSHVLRAGRRAAARQQEQRAARAA